jgi:hypothetical protein
MKIPLVGQDFTSRSLAVSAQTCINLFPALIDDPNEAASTATVTAPARGKNKAVLYGCPGKHLLGTMSGNLRGLWGGGGRCFIVTADGFLKEISSAGAVLSSVAFPSWFDNGLPAGIFSNGNQLLIVTAGLAYCDNGLGPVICTTDNYAGVVSPSNPGYFIAWVSGDQFLDDGSWVGRNIVINGSNYTVSATNPATGLPALPTKTGLFVTTLITPGPLQVPYTALGLPLTAVTGAVLDGTFFVQRPPTPGLGPTYPDLGRQVNFSAVLDGTSWNGLDFFQKEASPDYIRNIFVDGEQLYVWGTEAFEVWQADPNAVVGGNPFVRIPGAMGRYGNISAFAQDSLDGHVFFLGGDDRGQVSAYVLNGFTPVRVSNHAQEAAWQAASLGANAVSYAYMEEGHSFLVYNFGTQTWAYEPETGAWHQRYKWFAGAFTPYQTNLHVFIPEWGSGGKHVTAWTSGTGLYISSSTFYDDAGTDIAWQRAMPYIYNDGKWMYFGRLDLELETGAAPAGLPAITLDYSDDRGVTFQNPRVATVSAPIDASSTRVFWLRNGKSRGRVARLSGVGQYRVALIDLNWDIAMGTV